MRTATWWALTTIALCGACGGDDSPAGFEPSSGGSGGAATDGGGGFSGGRDGGAGASGAGALGGTAGAGGAGARGGAAAATAGGAGGESGAGGAPGGAGGAAGLSGSAGAGAVTCSGDPGPEPNDTEVLATPACLVLPCEMDECDSSGSTAFGGTLPPAQGTIGPGDVDFWRYHGKDTLAFCTVNASASTQDTGFRLCVFAACANGTSLRGCTQGAVAMSMVGFPGCCVDAPGTVELDHDCIASINDDDTADVYVRVDGAATCTSYTVDYHF